MENKEVKKIKMSVVRKVTKNLSPTDFEKPVDENLLDRLKKNVAELKNFSTLWLVLLVVVVVVAVAACRLMQIEKSVRFELFFAMIDENLLDRLKKNVAELKNFSTLWLVQLAVVVAVCLLMQLEKSVRFELFFAIIILPVVMNHFKQQKVDESFHRLGITETELKQAIDACKERMQS